MTLIKKNNTLFLFVMFCFISINMAFCQSDLYNSSNLEIKKILNDKQEYCAVPLDYNLNFSEKVDKVYNIQDVEQAINISGNERVIINTGVVYLRGEDSQAFYSPEKSEVAISKEFQKLLNIKLDSTLRKLDNLNQRIIKWDSTLVRFAQTLEELSNDDPKKPQGIELLKQYKQNIQTASCLNNDYGDEVVIETDEKGNKDYFFDLNKIKNDPNYFFLGIEREGFILAKKFNKYGYLSIDTSYQDIPFKYIEATDFTYGYAVVQDNHSQHIIDRSGNKILSYSKKDTELLTVLENGIFIKHGRGSIFDRNSYFIDLTGKIISDKFDSIEPEDFKDIFVGTWAVDTSKKTSKTSTSIPIANYDSYYKYFNNKGKELYLNRKDIKILEKDYAINSRDPLRYKQIMLLPDKKRMLFIINTDKNDDTFWILKDVYSKKVIAYDKIIQADYFFKLKNLSTTDKYIYNNDIIGYSLISYDFLHNSSFINESYISHDSESSKKLSFMNDTQIRESKKEFHKKLELYNIIKQENIGSTCIEIKGVFSDNELTLFGEHLGVKLPLDKNNRATENSKQSKTDNLELERYVPLTMVTGYGLINFDGQIVIPPLFKEIKYQQEEDYFQVIDYYENSYHINTNWNCIEGNCEDYRQLVREYYPLFGKQR